MLSVIYVVCHYAECRYVDCRYAGCHGAQLTTKNILMNKIVLF
jgi:hypothetical protein